MNILNELTLRNLKMNKKRTAVMVIGIILSTALICGVAGILTSFWNSMIGYTKKTDGNYHTIIHSVPKSEIENIEKNSNVDKIYVAENLGYSYLEKGTNENKPYLNVLAVSDDYLNNMAFNLKEGRFPENSNEIVISDHIKTNGGVTYNIGDEISLDISNRVSENGKVLDQTVGFEYKGIEKLEKKYTKTFKVVGIIYRPSYTVEEYTAPGYTVITKLDEITENAELAVIYKNTKKLEQTLVEITGMEEVVDDSEHGEDAIDIYYSGFDKTYTNSKYDVTFNSKLLTMEGKNLSDNNFGMIISIAGVIIAIILVSSVFVIRNGFAISVTERFKTYGMLSSIGATKKQLKKTVYFEGFIVGLIGIPLGILSGIFAIFILLKVVNFILIDLLDDFILSYSISILAIIISILISIITIYLSCISSARKASKISPMDLIRSTKDVKLNSKKVRSPKIIKKIFGIGGEIAYKNLKRSKKKYRTTVISIVVSIVIFIGISSVIEYGFKIGNVYYKEKDYNIELTTSNVDINKEEILKAYSKISKFDNIKESSIRKENYITIKNMRKYFTDFMKKIMEREYFNVSQDFPIRIIAVGDKQYKEYLKENKLKYEDCKDGAILHNICNSYNEEKGKREEGEIYKLKARRYYKWSFV